MSNPVIGIDLGTTFSAAAYINSDNKPELLPNAEGQYLTPSAIYLGEHSVVVGQPALDAGLTDPARLVEFVKRHMSDDNWHVSANGRTYSAIQLSAEILRKLKQDAEQALGQSIDRAVVTVPAYFKEPERRATKTAAELAGLELMYLMNEPTAAAVAYGLDHADQPQTILFFDLGGGTFDVSICRVEERSVRTLLTEGHAKLGGKDFDDAILQLVAKRFQEIQGLDLLTDEEALPDLRTKVIRAKHLLTRMDRAQIPVMAHGRRMSVEVSRQDFEDVTTRHLRYAEAIMNNMLLEGGLGLADIDGLMLVGGATRMPMIKRFLDAYFGRPVMLAGNPDEVVASGAAIYAERVKREGSGIVNEDDKIGNLSVVDVLSHSIGIQARGTVTGRQLNQILIKRNTPLPHEASQVFYVDEDHRTALRIVVLQGESTEIADSWRIGEFTLSGLPPGRTRNTPIDVYVRCNVNGIIEVHAVDRETGKRANVSIDYASLSE